MKTGDLVRVWVIMNRYSVSKVPRDSEKMTGIVIAKALHSEQLFRVLTPIGLLTITTSDMELYLGVTTLHDI